MSAHNYRIPVAVCICLMLLAAAGGAIAQCTFTGDIDTDFVGSPNTIIKDGTTLTPPYLISDGPVNPIAPNNTQDIVTGGVIPSGFHSSRLAISYDCGTDTMCIGFDVSNQSTLNGTPVPGMISRAWDADGDDDPCIVTNPLLIRNCTEPTCDGSTKHIDPLRLGNDDKPSNGQGEVYMAELDLNQDGFTDVSIQAIDDGFIAGTMTGAVDFKGPCDQDPTHVTPASWTDVIHVTLRNTIGQNMLLIPGVSVNMFYVQSRTDASYPTNRDIEFQIIGLRNIPLPPPGPGVTPFPVCEINVHTFLDSQFDASGEVDLDWADFTFLQEGTLGVTCSKTVSANQICALPTTVTYTLSATNTSSIPVLINIQDAQLGINQTSASCIQPGASFQVQQQVTYDATFCGHAPITNTMTATIDPESCNCMACVSTSGTTTCTSSTTVTFPTQVTAAVSCAKTVNTPQVCTLPSTVTYTLTATNTGNVPVRIRIQDTQLAIDQTSAGCIPVGQNFQLTKDVTYDATFCGHAPIVNTMTATASVGACATCVCGTITNPTCSSSATVTFPTPISFACESTVNGSSAQTFTVLQLPQLITYKFRAKNTGSSNLDLTIDELGTLPPGTTCDATFPAVFNDVAPGDFREVTCTATLDEAAANCPDGADFLTSITVSGVLSEQQGCTCETPSPSTCEVAVHITCGEQHLFQAFPGSSHNTDQNWLGYNGVSGDAITSVPGVFAFVPGPNWSNFIQAAQDNVPYTIKNVVLKKTTPEIIQCADVFPVKTIMQQGTPNIRTWWPLMYEVPGTTWTLTILYGTTFLYDDDGPGPNAPAFVHTETWTFTVTATVQSMKDLLELFHELPFGKDEVPLISDEDLYPILQQKLTDLKALLSAEVPDKVAAGLLLGDFEMEVMDRCIGVSPERPNPRGIGTGIAQTDENPACCKLLVDAEAVGFNEGIFTQNK